MIVICEWTSSGVDAYANHRVGTARQLPMWASMPLLHATTSNGFFVCLPCSTRAVGSLPVSSGQPNRKCYGQSMHTAVLSKAAQASILLDDAFLRVSISRLTLEHETWQDSHCLKACHGYQPSLGMMSEDCQASPCLQAWLIRLRLQSRTCVRRHNQFFYLCDRTTAGLQGSHAFKKPVPEYCEKLLRPICRYSRSGRHCQSQGRDWQANLAPARWVLSLWQP